MNVCGGVVERGHHDDVDARCHGTSLWHDSEMNTIYGALRRSKLSVSLSRWNDVRHEGNTISSWNIHDCKPSQGGTVLTVNLCTK